MDSLAYSKDQNELHSSGSALLRYKQSSVTEVHFMTV